MNEPSHSDKPQPDTLAEYDNLAAGEDNTTAPAVKPWVSPVKEYRERYSGKLSNKGSVKIYFGELIKVTHPNSTTSGAILIEVYTEGTEQLGTFKEMWLPKKLCSNMIYAPINTPHFHNTVQLWDVFANDEKNIISNYVGLVPPAASEPDALVTSDE